MQHFINQLAEINEHGQQFGCNFNYLEIISETSVGLVSKFNFKCKMCNRNFHVMSDDGEKGCMNVNQQAVSAVLSIGSGYTHLQTLTSSLDIPGVNPKLYLDTQSTVFDWWERAATYSMEQAAKAEKEYAISIGNVDENGIPMITVELDGCWCKRSYRTNYSALSGAAAIIGLNTGKVLYFGVKNKYCLICARAANKNVEPPEHTCYKNYSGPSTTMESAIVVQGFKSSLDMYGLIYNKFIADGDSSTYKAILDARPYPSVTVEKIECKNALVKVSQDTNYPCELRKIIKERYLRLRIGVTKAISYWGEQDLTFEQKVSNLAKDIQNGPRHVFGDHSNCSPYFCTPETRRPEATNLIPPLVTSGLMAVLQNLGQKLSYHARSLIHNVTSNLVESLNAQVAKYVGGKRINYALRRSYAGRCAAAVVAFNTGTLHTFTHRVAFEKDCNHFISRVEKFRLNKIKKCKTKQKRFHTTKSKDYHYGEDCQKPDMSATLYEKAKKDFLRGLEMNVSERMMLERTTVLQRASGEWMSKRRKLLTASNFGAVCKKNKATRCNKLVTTIVYGSNLSSLPAVRYGIENEERAIEKLALQENVLISGCGLFIDKDLPFLGASPDGIYADGIVEIKCPSSLARMSLQDAKAKHQFWKFDKNLNNYVINKNHNWYFQAQGQLHVTNRDICMFAIWFGEDMPMDVYHIHRNDTFWQEKMEGKLKDFYMECVLPELIDPRIPRSMEIREPQAILEAIEEKRIRSINTV